MYSQYNSSIYQPLRADAEGSAVDCERVQTFARKIILKTINFNRLQLREQDKMCTIFVDLDYF